MAEPGAPRARWTGITEGELERLSAAGRWRAPRSFDARGPRGRLADGREVVAFASNDYLGLGCHPQVVAAAQQAAARWGTGAGASRLVTGSRPVHGQLEEALADWKGTEAAVVLPTGFAANLAVLSALGRLAGSILSDELNHASIVDGCRLARAPVAVFAHRDVDHLEALLAEAPRPALVVSDAVFSMDGDLAPVDDLLACCAHHQALVVLDEAHSVFGPEVPSSSEGPMVVRVGTLSKTLGALGGFLAGPRAVVDLVVNAGRPYIFTTALSPPDTAAALAALEVLRSPSGEALVDRLRHHLDRLAPGAESPIVPVVVGSEADALAASAALLDRGVFVPAIRPPTVPEGTSRLRITVSAEHRHDEVVALATALSEALGPGWPTKVPGAGGVTSGGRAAS